MTFNKFAAGRKVYGQGATSPTRGAVDPSGYIKRELARRSNQQGVSRVGKDGQSDTRSGIAHNAIRNNLGNNAPRPQAGSLNAPNQPQGMTNMPRYLAGNNTTTPVGTNGAAPVGSMPSVQVTNDGVLQLPYNSEFANQALDAQNEFDNQMLDLNYADQNQDAEYAQFMRELEQGYTDRQRDTLSNSSGRGMLYSSQYTTGANNDAREYNNAKNDAESENTRFNNDITTRRTAAQTWLNQLLQRATQGYADSLAENAGGLGFGADGLPAANSAAAAAGRANAPVLGHNGMYNNTGRPQASSLPKPPKGPKMVNQPKPPKKKGKK